MTDFLDMAPEFSRPLAVDAIGPNGSVVELEADPEERRRLAERFDLRLSIGWRTPVVTRGPIGLPIRGTGRLRASFVEHCVATLDPVASEIDEPVEAEYAPAAADGGEEVIDLNQPDPPEPLEGDRIELGELVAQHLSVALDPYPRKKGIEPLDWSEPQRSEDGSDPDNPFSVLAPLHKKRT